MISRVFWLDFFKFSGPLCCRTCIIYDFLFSSTDEDQQPSLFELADIEESNEALMMPPPPAAGGANASMPSLETPLISVDDTLDLNPLVAQITSKKGRKKMS